MNEQGIYNTCMQIAIHHGSHCIHSVSYGSAQGAGCGGSPSATQTAFTWLDNVFMTSDRNHEYEGT